MRKSNKKPLRYATVRLYYFERRFLHHVTCLQCGHFK